MFAATSSGRALRPPPAVVVLASGAAEHRGAIGRMARELGYRAIESDDPADVLRRLRAHPAFAQLLLVEVSLRGMDGGEVAERARDLAPGIRIAFLSRDPDGADAELIRADNVFFGFRGRQNDDRDAAQLGVFAYFAQCFEPAFARETPGWACGP